MCVSMSEGHIPKDGVQCQRVLYICNFAIHLQPSVFLRWGLSMYPKLPQSHHPLASASQLCVYRSALHAFWLSEKVCHAQITSFSMKKLHCIHVCWELAPHGFSTWGISDVNTTMTIVTDVCLLCAVFLSVVKCHVPLVSLETLGSDTLQIRGLERRCQHSHLNLWSCWHWVWD